MPAEQNGDVRGIVATPIGPLAVETDGDVVVGVRFGGTGSPAEHQVADQLRAYFAGTLTDFTVASAAPRGSAIERAGGAAFVLTLRLAARGGAAPHSAAPSALAGAPPAPDGARSDAASRG